MATVTQTTIELVPNTSLSQLNVLTPDQAKPDADQDATSIEAQPAKVETKRATALIITIITGVTMISSMLSGFITIALPQMANDLSIPPALLFWPASIYSLTCGCTLIICGALADEIGARKMYLAGTLLQSIFTLACGLARTSTQIIVFRALAGVAISFCLPSAVSLIMAYFPAGPRRNLAFGTMGGGNPLGFTIGLVMGGGLTDAAGWQVGLYMSAGINTLLLILAFFALPKLRNDPVTLRSIATNIDWVGAMLLSSSLALLLYVFATWTGDLAQIKSAQSISCLVLGVVLLPVFAFWVHRQERRGKAVLIRNSLWRNKAFTSICINVFLIWGSFNATELFVTFLFQDVQGLSATQASVRFLPEPVVGAMVNVLVGLYVHRVRASWALQGSFVLAAVAPLLLAVMRERASYWEFEFPAVALIPIATDVLYTISQLLITAEFPENTQALAGGVFNTVAQIGKSVGIALTAIVASGVSAQKKHASSEEALLEGYRAAWWFAFAMTVACMCVTATGLRGLGKVGLKQE